MLAKVRRLAVIATLGCVAIAAELAAIPAPPSAAALAPSRAVGTIAVTTMAGKRIAPGATLQRGQRVIVDVAGFRPSASVKLLVQSGPLLAAVQSVEASRTGEVRVTYTASASLTPGAHVLALTGPGPASDAAGIGADTAASVTLTVTVPKCEWFPFTVDSW